jgi:hypothetical protein
MHMYPVVYLANMDEAGLGERALTICTYSSYKYGGFCVAPPGQCSSAEFLGVSETDRQAIWAARQRWHEEENGTFYSNEAREVERIELDKPHVDVWCLREQQEQQAIIDANNAEIERLTKESAELESLQDILGRLSFGQRCVFVGASTESRG